MGVAVPLREDIARDLAGDAISATLAEHPAGACDDHADGQETDLLQSPENARRLQASISRLENG